MFLLGNDILLVNRGNIYKLQAGPKGPNNEFDFEDNPIYAPINEFIKRFQLFKDYELLDFYITFPKDSGIPPISLTFDDGEYGPRYAQTFDDLLFMLELLDKPDQRIWSIYVLFREPRTK